MEISKSLKVLATLNETGRSGTANLLYQYEKNFPDDYMTRKLLTDILGQHQVAGRVRKQYGRRNKQFWGYVPQIYEISKHGKSFLRSEGII